MKSTKTKLGIKVEDLYHSGTGQCVTEHQSTSILHVFDHLISLMSSYCSPGTVVLY